MTQRLVQLLGLYLLLGLSATSVVAFGCWAILDLSVTPYEMHHPSGRTWGSDVEEFFPAVTSGRRRGAAWWMVIRASEDPTEDAIERSVPRWTGLWRRDWGELTEASDSRMLAAYGWPCLALSARRESAIRNLGNRGAPPLTPVWGGLLADTLVFAGVVALAHQSVAVAARRRRRGRGACAVCSYDLSGITGPCPECGKEQQV